MNDAVAELMGLPLVKALGLGQGDEVWTLPHASHLAKQAKTK